MKIVLDTNIILSALIKNSFSRKIITSLDFDFFVPSFSLTEIFKHKKLICNKANISEKQFNLLFKKIFEYVKIIPASIYLDKIPLSLKLISDANDAPFLACAMFFNSAIWSNDKHFKEQKKIRVYTTEEFVKNFLKGKTNHRKV